MGYAKGESGNLSGKPRGANKTQKLRTQLMGEVPEILAALVRQAKNGDVAASKAILAITIPPARPETYVHLLPVADTVAAQADAVVSAVLGGLLSVETGDSLISLLAARVGMWKAVEFWQRLAELEETVAGLVQKRAALGAG